MPDDFMDERIDKLLPPYLSEVLSHKREDKVDVIFLLQVEILMLYE